MNTLKSLRLSSRGNDIAQRRVQGWDAQGVHHQDAFGCDRRRRGGEGGNGMKVG